MARRAGRIAAVTVAAAVVLGACTSSHATGSGPAVTSTSIAPTTTATTSVADLKAAILAQWLAAYQANAAAAKDPTSPAVTLLVDYFVDPTLSFLRKQYAARARDGLADAGTVDLGQPRIESMTATRAVVVSCETNGLYLIFRATGKRFPGSAGDPTPVPSGIRSTLVVTPSGAWKVSESSGKDGSCVGF